MTARPYAIVAYRPAARSELRTTEINCCMCAQHDDGQSSTRNRRDRVASHRRFRPDEIEFAPSFVLCDHERQRRFSRFAEFQNASRQNRVLQLELRPTIADRVGVE